MNPDIIENSDHVDEEQNTEMDSRIAAEKSALARLNSEEDDLF